MVLFFFSLQSFHFEQKAFFGHLGLPWDYENFQYF